MKKLLLFVAMFMATVYNTNAHCYVTRPCTSSVTHSSSPGPGGAISISTTYTGDKCFYAPTRTGPGGVFRDSVIYTTGTNFNLWGFLYFNGGITHNYQTLNMPSGVGYIDYYTYGSGYHTAEKITVNGWDTIRTDGELNIIDLVSNNSTTGKHNVILTNYRVKIRGKYYYPKDTFFSSPGVSETKVLIGNCSGTVLPIKLVDFYYQDRKLFWEVGVEYDILNYNVLYSADGTQWNKYKTIKANNVAGSKYNTEVNNNGYYKLQILEIDSTFLFSPTVKVNENKENGIKLFPNPVGNMLNIESNGIVSIEIYNFNGLLIGKYTDSKISTEQLSSGNYYIKAVDNNGKIFVNKFTKQ